MTVMLMAIATAMVVPTFSEGDSSNVRAATWLLVGELDFAQATAITDPSDQVRVTFDTSASRFWVAYAATPMDPILAPYTDAPHDVSFGVGAGEPASGVSIALAGIDVSYIEYDAFGRITSSTPPRITLSRSDAAMTVTLSTDTGFLTVTDE